VTRAAVVACVVLAAIAGGWRLHVRAQTPPASPSAPPHDAPPAPRLRARTAAVHSDDPSARGTTAWLFAHDPSAAYAAGRELFTREFTDAEGVFGHPIARPLLPDGRTPMVPGARAASCAACHNSPFGDAGAGPTIAKNGPSGRNTPHLFGAGLVEMIGWEIRARLLAAGDPEGRGFIDKDAARGRRAVVWNLDDPAAPGRVALDFGRFDDADGDGRPDLDPVCRTWFVDASGRRVTGARRLDDPGVAGYDLEVQVFGWGHGVDGAPLSSTLRGFSAAAFNVHAGLQAHDPTLNRDGDGFGVTGRSLCGAPQFFTGRTPDAGRALGADGVSLDDPDGDGVADELTEGDMDLVEFFLLHHPAPRETAPTPRTRRGRTLFESVGCVRCHVSDWSIANDRRVFDPLTGARCAGGPLVVRGVYSDFRRHDLGPAFHQRQFDGSEVRSFRTPPLWGVGSSAPYGHDGASLDLDAVIRRHAGEAAKECAAYAALADDDRDALVSYLRGLVLFRVDDAVRAR
jgi:hypothetical protein